jgi:trk system potassium uptake protein TrkA
MNIIIIGAGNSGSYLAEKLQDRNNITLIEYRPETATAVAKRLPGCKVIRGDGCEPATLERANIASADLVASLTGHDEDNLVTSFLAKETYKVPLVFARTNHPSNEWLFTKFLGVDVAVSAASIISGLVEKEVGIGDVMTLLKLAGKGMAIEDICLPENSFGVGKKISELELPKTAHVMAIVSGEEVVIPQGSTLLKAHDRVLLISHAEDSENLRKTFGI